MVRVNAPRNYAPALSGEPVRDKFCVHLILKDRNGGVGLAVNCHGSGTICSYCILKTVRSAYRHCNCADEQQQLCSARQHYVKMRQGYSSVLPSTADTLGFLPALMQEHRSRLLRCQGPQIPSRPEAGIWEENFGSWACWGLSLHSDGGRGKLKALNSTVSTQYTMQSGSMRCCEGHMSK